MINEKFSFARQIMQNNTSCRQVLRRLFRAGLRSSPFLGLGKNQRSGCEIPRWKNKIMFRLETAWLVGRKDVPRLETVSLEERMFRLEIFSIRIKWSDWNPSWWIRLGTTLFRPAGTRDVSKKEPIFLLGIASWKNWCFYSKTFQFDCACLIISFKYMRFHCMLPSFNIDRKEMSTKLRTEYQSPLHPISVLYS